jgi:GTPase
MRFIDEATIKVRAGDGGAGMIAWRREKFIPLGGPAGGDGGKGGDVIFIAKEGMNSLLDLKKQSIITAENGYKGQSKNKTGKNGRDKIVFVPVGTVIKNKASYDDLHYDLIHHGQQVVVCKGGDGGFGNSHFKTQRCNAPYRATNGFKGEERELALTLKLMADVGLLGFPNAGKSTLLTRLSNARPKVADYPFTTIKPMIGVCELEIGQTMVLADIPGLIEGASMGQGLGFRFLRHLERVSVLCHLVDASEDVNLIERILLINNELKLYSDYLAKLPQVVAINKIDAMNCEQEKRVNDLVNYLERKSLRVLKISAVTGKGLPDLTKSLYDITKNINKISALDNNNSQKFDPTLRL